MIDMILRILKFTYFTGVGVMGILTLAFSIYSFIEEKYEGIGKIIGNLIFIIIASVFWPFILIYIGYHTKKYNKEDHE